MTDIPTVPIEHQILLRIPEAAALMGLSETGVKELLRRGELATVTLGGTRRIPRRAIDELAANYDQAPRCAQCQRERTELLDYMRRPNGRKEKTM